MKMTIAAVLIALTSVAAAAADLGQQCAAAYESGKAAEASRIASQLTSGRHILSEVGILAGRYCIESVLGAPHEFNHMKGHYEKVDMEVRKAEQARLDALKIAAQAEEKKLQEAALEAERVEKEAVQARQQAARAEEARREAERERISQILAKRQAEPEAAVWEQTSAACTRLYKRKPDEALLTTVCRSLFLEVGLPK